MNATDRARSDRLDYDLHQATDRELEQLAQRLTRNPALCDCERRNAYGFPVPSRAAASESDYADWAPADREALAATQAQVRDILDDWLEPDDIDWVTEETLTQQGVQLLRTGTLRIPRVCQITLRAGVLSIAPAPELDLTRGGYGHD
jgi:hypothetical protein